MGRLIDADRLLKCTKFYNLPNGNKAIDEIDILHAPTIQAIPIPKGATNGDMIKAMFPEIEVKPVNFDGKIIGYDVWDLDNGTDGATYFTKDFWDAPYKKEVEE